MHKRVKVLNFSCFIIIRYTCKYQVRNKEWSFKKNAWHVTIFFSFQECALLYVRHTYLRGAYLTRCFTRECIVISDSKFLIISLIVHTPLHRLTAVTYSLYIAAVNRSLTACVRFYICKKAISLRMMPIIHLKAVNLRPFYGVWG